MKKLWLITWLMALAVGVVPAQDSAKENPQQAPKAEKPAPKPLGAYKLEFVLRELQDGKVINTRSYTLIVQDGYRHADLKIGSKVPVRTKENDFQYLDIGTNISCNHLEEQAPLLGLECTVEISNFALPDQKLTSGITSAPVLNQVRADIPALVPEGKQTVIGMIDDPNSTRRYEIAVTPTKIKP